MALITTTIKVKFDTSNTFRHKKATKTVTPNSLSLPEDVQGVDKLLLRFQKFIIVLFFKIFSIDFFYSKGKCFKFTLDALVHLYVCTISRTYDIQLIFNFLPCSC